MAHDLVVYDSILGSNIPRQEKSMIARWMEGGGSLMGGMQMPTLESVVTTGLQAARATGEAGFAGGLLGLAHAMLPNGLDAANGKLPIDAALGALGVAGAVAFSGREMSRDSLNLGMAGVGVFFFRKTNELLGEVRLNKRAALTAAGGAKVHGEAEDPIAAAARAL